MVDRILKDARQLAQAAAGVPDRAAMKAHYHHLLEMVNDYFNPDRSPDLCRECGAPIVWVKTTPKGANAPLDAVAISGIDVNGEAHTIHLNHFSTCPDAEAFRPEKSDDADPINGKTLAAGSAS